MKKFFIVLLLVLFVALTGCSNSGNEGSSGQGGGEQTVTPTDADHIIVAVTQKMASFEPSSNDSAVLNRLVYDYIIDIDRATGELLPGLATEWEWVDGDTSKLHLKLREGVKFHNGNPFTAEDVEYSLATNVNSNITGNYDHSEILGDYEMIIHLQAPNADFVYLVTPTNYAGVKDKESCEADENLGSSYGTGPWVIDMANTVPGDTVELVRYDEYWGEKPVPSKLTLRYIDSATSRLLALQNKEVHAMMDVGETDVETVKNDPNLEFKSGAGIGHAKYYYLAFNMHNGAAKDNLYLRQAIARAINPADIIAAVGDLEATPSDGALWGMITPYRAKASDFTVDLSYNVEEAKALVEKAKEAAGGTLPELHITGNTSKSINMNYILVAQEACRQVGITLVIDETDGDGVNAKTKFSSGDYDIVMHNTPLESWPSGVNRMLLYSESSSNNRALINNDEITANLKEASATSDVARKEELYKAVQVYIHDNAIYVPGYYGSRNGAELKGVEGIVWANDGYPDFRYVTYSE